MKKVIRWIVLVWTVIALPYVLTGDTIQTFFSFLYAALISGLMISDLREKSK